MKLWILWWSTVWQLRPDCSRLRNFLWFATVLAGITVRPDLIGVSSIIRGLGLKVSCYVHLLDYFYSNSRLNNDSDFQELRINIDSFNEQIDLIKFRNYLAQFNSKTLEKRVNKFLKFVSHA